MALCDCGSFLSLIGPIPLWISPRDRYLKLHGGGGTFITLLLASFRHVRASNLFVLFSFFGFPYNSE